jgi:hypothetical protein
MLKNLFSLFKAKSPAVVHDPILEYQLEISKIKKGMTVKSMPDDLVRVNCEGSSSTRRVFFDTTGIHGKVVGIMNVKNNARRSIMIKIETTAGQKYNAWFYTGQKTTVLRLLTR